MRLDKLCKFWQNLILGSYFFFLYICTYRFQLFLSLLESVYEVTSIPTSYAFVLQELSVDGDCFTPSDVERALWSSAVGSMSLTSSSDDPKTSTKRSIKRKRKSWGKFVSNESPTSSRPHAFKFLNCSNQRFSSVIIMFCESSFNR